MRKAVRSLIILFVVVSLVIVPSMAMAAAAAGAGAAAGTAAGGATFAGISMPLLIVGGVLFGALVIYVAADLLTTTTHH